MQGKERVGLKEFAGYVRAGERSRHSLVLNARTRCESDYLPYMDPYRPLRQAIVKMHSNGFDPTLLDNAVQSATSQRRRTILREAAACYFTWLDGRIPEHVPVPSDNWNHAGAQVRVNPELGLVIDGQPHIIKLHFPKGNPVDEQDARIMTRILRLGLGSTVRPEFLMSVLDVHSCMLFIEGPDDDELDPLIHDAALSLAREWDQAA